MDKEHVEHPAKGVIVMTDFLLESGFRLGRWRIRRMMRLMGLQPVYPKRSQFTAREWLEACNKYPYMQVSMDGRGLDKDDIWIERFWKTIKCEYIYIQPEENGRDLYRGIKEFIDDYNFHRPHHGIDHKVPGRLYILQAAWS
jgi:transposase InsO family protein